MLIIDPEECIDCFAPSETFVTSFGVRSFEELENQACRVLTDTGFAPAVVKRFRRRPLVNIELAPAFEERDRYGATRLTTRNRSRFRRVVRATPTHTWLLHDGERTEALAPGQFVPSARAVPQRDSENYRLGVLHGLVFSDGSLEQARGSVGGAPPLRPALRRSRCEIQGLLRPGELLAVPRRSSRVRRHGRRSLAGQPEADAPGDGRPGVHRGIRRRPARRRR